MARNLFQRMLDGELPMPRAAATLGANIIEIDPSEGTIVVRFVLSIAQGQALTS